jgi:hypothetical protein
MQEAVLVKTSYQRNCPPVRRGGYNMDIWVKKSFFYTFLTLYIEFLLALVLRFEPVPFLRDALKKHNDSFFTPGP